MGKSSINHSNLLQFSGYGLKKTKGKSTLSKPWTVTGSNTLRGLEKSANKKLNKHSNSLDNTDWIAYHEKLRKDISVNSPKSLGRVSVTNNRTKGVVIAEKFFKESGLTKAQARLKKSTNLAKSKHQQGLAIGRLNSISDGRRTTISKTPRPILLLHQKK
eukprot:TRINITY_DN15598_c0_g2_i2.p1 TRINITY_DN15598_c0_g2~~TRINITY_DN15598_c0_g2_i2.p1  ORF type:complete len:160 (+),score=13.02 TRINITY_DN15598_c0_g2_i2:221-700(+)